MDFEWDDRKSEANYKKHGVRFSEAVTIWHDENSLEIHDEEHSTHSEDRWIRMGYSNRSRMLIVVYCERFEVERIRIISARKATLKEERDYYLR